MPSFAEMATKMAGAQIFNRGNYVRADGEFEVEIEKLSYKKAYKNGTELATLEFTIVSAQYTPPQTVRLLPPEEQAKLSNAFAQTYVPGSKWTWQPKLSNENTGGDLKCFVFACLGLEGRNIPLSDQDSHRLAIDIAFTLLGDPDCAARAKVHPKMVEYGLTPESVVVGAHVLLKTEQIITRETKQPFTRHTWSPVPAAS